MPGQLNGEERGLFSCGGSPNLFLKVGFDDLDIDSRSAIPHGCSPRFNHEHPRGIQLTIEADYFIRSSRIAAYHHNVGIIGGVFLVGGRDYLWSVL